MTRLVITCNSPYDVMKYTLNFRSYLPIPNGLEFHSNQTYYFLSTSSSHRQCNKLKIVVHDYSKYHKLHLRLDDIHNIDGFFYIALRNDMIV